jgi:TatD-related deoxyribonuclease
MKPPIHPITDDHIHIDPRNGRGIEAAKDFKRAGGTHLFLVSKPAGSLGVLPARGEDYREVFEETLRVAALVRETGLTVFPVLGVHPAEISTLSTRMPLPQAALVMKEGLDIAASYVAEGAAVALKSGRPHYEVPPDVITASNVVLAHAFHLARECCCAVQVHAETGPCTDMIEIAAAVGLIPGKVVKHYATPDTPLVPSLLATHPAVPVLAAQGRMFTMESDYMDENNRPGAVIGPKSVPRTTRSLLLQGAITVEDAIRIHSTTPSAVYGVGIDL